MRLSRRFILIAVLVVASAVSLGFAGNAKANIVSQLKSECKAQGGTLIEGTKDGQRFVRCEYRVCTMKLLQVGKITILYPSCQAKATEIRWST